MQVLRRSAERRDYENATILISVLSEYCGVSNSTVERINLQKPYCSVESRLLLNSREIYNTFGMAVKTRFVQNHAGKIIVMTFSEKKSDEVEHQRVKR
jgi:hypothetical protein